MHFTELMNTQGPVTEDSSDYRRVIIYQADEALDEEITDAQIRVELRVFLRDQGYPVDGESCHHEYDCCGNFYADPIDIIRIDRIYDQVWIEIRFTHNV